MKDAQGTGGDSPGDEGGSDLYSCDQCDTSFVTKRSLDSHMKGFHPVPKVNAEIPETQNVSPPSVLRKRPRKVVPKELPEVRKVNGKQGTPPEAAEVRRAYPCQLCNKEFGQQDELTHHVNTIHSEVTITLASPPKPKRPVSLLKRPLDMTGVAEEQKLKTVKKEHKPEPTFHQLQIADGKFEITEVVRSLLISHMNAESGREAEAAAAAKKLASSPASLLSQSALSAQSPVDNRHNSDDEDEFEGEGSDDFDGETEHHDMMFPVVTIDEDLNGEFACSDCGASFHTPQKLELHMEQHNAANRPFKCDRCPGRGFVRKEHLTKHCNSVHSGMKFTCAICGKDISRRDHLVRHLRSVHRCSIPPGLDLLATSNNVEVTANSAASTASTILQLQFDDISDTALLQSSLQPKPKKGYKCDMCDETFTQLEMLFQHQRESHSDVRKYNCSLCSKSFKRREHLQKHVVLHSGEKKFSCTSCSKSFPRNDALHDHLRRIHGAVRPTDAEEFPCSLCDKIFLQNSNLVRHRNQVHNITLAVAIANGPIRGGVDDGTSDSNDGTQMNRLMMTLLGKSSSGGSGKAVKVQRPPVPELLPIENFHFQPTTTAGRN